MTIAKGILDRYRLLADPVPFHGGLIRSGHDPFADCPITAFEIPNGFPGFQSGLLVADVREGNRVTHPNLLPALSEMASPANISYLVTAASKGMRLDEFPEDKGLTLAGGMLIARVLCNVLDYCWKSGIEGLCIASGTILVTPNGIRIASIAECRLRARATGQPPNGQTSDVVGFGEVLGRVIELCRSAGNACVPLEMALATLGSPGGFGRARCLIHDWSRTSNADAAESPPGGILQKELEAGDYLFREGDSSNDCFFVLQKGMLQIVKSDVDDNEVFLDFTKPGELVGEMALIEQEPRMATARALEPSTLLVIGGEQFRKRLSKLDNVAMKLIVTLSNRLRERAAEITELKATIGGGRGHG